MGSRSVLRTLLLLALAAMTASPAAAGDKGKPAGIERSPEFVAVVNAAIDKGVAWLRTREGPDSFAMEEYARYPGGIPAFAIYTLRACGVSREEPVVAKGLAKLRTMFYAQREKEECRTYVVALMCMAAADGPLAPSVAKGGTSDRGRGPPSARDVEWLQDMVKWLERAQSGAGGWSYASNAGGYDFSNTQFALLGLRAADRGGAIVRSKTWSKALDLYLQSQAADGPKVPRFVPLKPGATTDARIEDRARGWGYRERDDGETPDVTELPYGSMTASGVAAVAICRDQLSAHSVLGDAGPAAERSIRDGIAWLGLSFSVEENPGPGRGPMWSTLYYYLYGLERAGMLAPVDWMGDHDWYGEGARMLTAAQCGDGTWPPGASNGTDTMLSTLCALLFLKRGTVRDPHSMPALTPSSDEAPINLDAARNLPEREFDEFIAQMLARVRNAGAGPARERVLADVTKVGPRILSPLVQRLTSSLAPEREAAFALLRHATGLDHEYDPGAAPDALEAAVTRWQSWLLVHSKELRYDTDLGRIVAK